MLGSVPQNPPPTQGDQKATAFSRIADGFKRKLSRPSPTNIDGRAIPAKRPQSQQRSKERGSNASKEVPTGSQRQRPLKSAAGVDFPDARSSHKRTCSHNTSSWRNSSSVTLSGVAVARQNNLLGPWPLHPPRPNPLTRNWAGDGPSTQTTLSYSTLHELSTNTISTELTGEVVAPYSTSSQHTRPNLSYFPVPESIIPGSLDTDCTPPQDQTRCRFDRAMFAGLLHLPDMETHDPNTVMEETLQEVFMADGPGRDLSVANSRFANMGKLTGYRKGSCLPYIGPGCQGWPPGRIPAEVFARITYFLPRDSLQILRLVNHEFDHMVSHELFKTVVVPFRPELYGMLKVSRTSPVKPNIKGKAKAQVGPNKDEGDLVNDALHNLYWAKAKGGSLHDGMKVFQGFGRHIRKFGMSFEVDEDMLSNPPEKPKPEPHRSFWGEYHWPQQEYNRSEICAGLERTADQSQSMAAAFSNLTEVGELAISIVSGLGWLCGPDTTFRGEVFKVKPRVFGSSNPLPDAETRERMKVWKAMCDHYRTWRITISNRNRGRLGEPHMRFVMQNLMAAFAQRISSLHTGTNAASTAPNRPDLTEQAGRLSLMDTYDDENTVKDRKKGNRLSDSQVDYAGQTAGAANLESSDQPSSNALLHDPKQSGLVQQSGRWSTNQASDDDGLYEEIKQQQSVHSDSNGDSEKDDKEAQTEKGLGSKDSEQAADQSPKGASDANHELRNNEHSSLPTYYDIAMATSTPRDVIPGFYPFEKSPLIPLILTTAQKECLLEMEWAQGAFLASYTLAVIDNKDNFKSVHTLNIATLSSRHLASLCRHDFWSALPNVRNLEINISPDWRDITKDGADVVATSRIHPSDAAFALGSFVQEYISPMKSIENLRLGWRGGGEHATGVCARNKYVLPAPLLVPVFDGAGMEAKSVGCNSLHLPHVKQLTLDNCWFYPERLIEFVQLHEKSLRNLRLASFSLSAPQVVPEGESGSPNQPVLDQDAPLEWLSYVHRPFSWPDVIDKITPGTTLTDLRYAYFADLDPPAQRARTCLQRLDFQSCGYVLLPSTPSLDQSHIAGPSGWYKMIGRVAWRLKSISPLMMGRGPDVKLRDISTWMMPQELDTLHHAWGMHEGWDCLGYPKDQREEGQPDGGSGRFTGFVQRSDDPTPTPYPASGF